MSPARTPARILAGILSLEAPWKEPFVDRMTPLLGRLEQDARLELGCVLRQGAFEVGPDGAVHCSRPEEALIYFMLRLIARLQQMGAAPAIDFAEYLRSFK